MRLRRVSLLFFVSRYHQVPKIEGNNKRCIRYFSCIWKDKVLEKYNDQRKILMNAPFLGFTYLKREVKTPTAIPTIKVANNNLLTFLPCALALHLIYNLALISERVFPKTISRILLSQFTF